MKKNNTFLRLLNYMLRYKTFTAVALTFILLTSIVATAIPLLAQYYIDNYITKGIASAGLGLLIIYYGLFLFRVISTFIGEYYFSKVAICVRRALQIFKN